jgi:hypothetical protein
MKIPILSRAYATRTDPFRNSSNSGVGPSDVDCTVNGWCKCKDEGGTRTASGDGTGASEMDCCMDAVDKMKANCDAICVGIGGRDKYEPCNCSAVADLWDCGHH